MPITLLHLEAMRKADLRTRSTATQSRPNTLQDGDESEAVMKALTLLTGCTWQGNLWIKSSESPQGKCQGSPDFIKGKPDRTE